MNATCEIRNCEKQSICDKNECAAPPVCNSVCSKPPVCCKEYSPVYKHCHQSCDRPRRHHSHETFYNANDCCDGGRNTREIVIIEEGRCGRREPYYNTNYGCGRSVSGERGPVTRIILSGNSGESNKVGACGSSLSACNSGECNVKEALLVDKDRSCRRDKCDFQLIKEDFTTKTCSTRAHRVYEKKLPRRQNTVEIVIKQDQPSKAECAAPSVCNPVCPQPRAYSTVYQQPQVQPYYQSPCCPNQESYPVITCHHHHHHYKSRRSRSCDNFYNDCDDRCYRYRSGRRLRPSGRVYIDDEIDRGCCRNVCEERRPISKVVLIRGEEKNRGCECAQTAQKCCCTRSCNSPVICGDTKPQCCQCNQPCPNSNTCHCVVVPIQMEKRRHSCCHCIKKLLGRKKSTTCC